MTTVERTFTATAAQVWAVLADGWTYSNWVVGTSHVRAVDEAWPAVGSRLLHASGIWPVVLRDETQILVSEPERHLQLQARGRPAGEATVDLHLVPDGASTLVRMAETPTKGPAAWVHNPVADLVVARRNVEALSRLAMLVERHRP